MTRQKFFSEYFAPNTWSREGHISGTLKKIGVKNKKVLDGGCGTGFFMNILDEMGAKTVGIDIIPTNVILAKNNVPRATTVASDIEILPFKSKTFDLILCTEVLEHCWNDMKALNDFYRVLKPNGILVLTVPNINYKYSLLEVWLSRIFGKLSHHVYTDDSHEELHRNSYTRLGVIEKLEKNNFKITSIFTITKTFSKITNKTVMIIERIDRLLRHKKNLAMHLADHKVRGGVFLKLYRILVLPIIRRLIKLDYLCQKEGASIFLIATK